MLKGAHEAHEDDLNVMPVIDLLESQSTKALFNVSDCTTCTILSDQDVDEDEEKSLGERVQQYKAE